VKSDGSLWLLGVWSMQFRSVDDVKVDYIPPSRLPDLDQIASLGARKLIRTDGTVWGPSWDGEKWVWQQLAGLTNVISVTKASWHASTERISGTDWFALRKDGTVLRWTDETHYDAKWQVQSRVASTPVMVAGLADIVAIAANAFSRTHVVALKRDGTAWCWGENTFGQVGDGTLEDRSAPVSVPDFRLY